MPGRIGINGTYWFVLHSCVRMLNSSFDQKATVCRQPGQAGLAPEPNHFETTNPDYITSTADGRGLKAGKGVRNLSTVEKQLLCNYEKSSGPPTQYDACSSSVHSL
ncbi:hypothetical protein T08_1356 [Trichinella sp. T8]|nr:hypothetical protein T08_1356 [Trichinella sp. T8]